VRREYDRVHLAKKTVLQFFVANHDFERSRQLPAIPFDVSQEWQLTICVTCRFIV